VAGQAKLVFQKLKLWESFYKKRFRGGPVMKSIRVLRVGLALLLGVAAIAAAGGRSARDGGGSSGGVTTIQVWTIDAHNKIEYDSLIEKFNNGIGAEKGIKIEYIVYGSDWNQVMDTALATGSEPDLFGGPANLIQYQMEGKFLPWKEIPGIEDVLKAQEPYHVKNDSIFDGDVYSVVLYGNYTVLHYNKRLLQRAGISAPPKTWAEFEDAAIRISKLDPGNIYGYAIPLAFYPFYREWMIERAAANSVGHMFFNFSQGKYQFSDYAPYLESLRRIVDAGAMFPGIESLTDDQMRALFAEGKIGFILGGGWNVGVLYDQFPFKDPVTGQPDPDGWDFAPLPVMNSSQTYAVPISAGASRFASAKLRNNREKLNKIGEVINLLSGDEIQSLLFSTGKNMPLRADIIAKAAPSSRFQWTNYGKAAPFTVSLPAMPHGFLAPEGAEMTDIISQVITGQIPARDIRSALVDMEKRYDAAFDQAIQRGIIKREDFIDPNFEARFRK
jgi:multiple sugar transport system substrate-binding protein